MSSETHFVFSFIGTNFVFMFIWEFTSCRTKERKAIYSVLRFPKNARTLGRLLAEEGSGPMVQLRSRVPTNSACLSTSPKDHESKKITLTTTSPNFDFFPMNLKNILAQDNYSDNK